MKALFLLIGSFLFSSLSFALSVETYNIGLARGFVDHAEERMPHIIDDLKRAAPDILCLQEAWSVADRKRILNTLKETFPYTHMPPVHQTLTDKRPSCMPWELFGKGKFVSCMQSQCGNASADEFADCIVNKCGKSLAGLKAENRECASALMAKVGQNPVLSVLKLMNPFSRSGLYAYGGSSGLALFSKRPFRDTEVIDFSDISTLNRRQALSATISHNGEDIKVICAHLAAKLSAPYTGSSESWQDENFNQVKRLIARSTAGPKAILMGDFNCGLKGSNLQAELPQSCELLRSAFSDPGADLNQCTYCSTNNLVSGNESSFIDHIYLRGLQAREAKIVRKTKVQIRAKKKNLRTNLSDHFGLRMKIEIKDN